jgi:hypothetical protein
LTISAPVSGGAQRFAADWRADAALLASPTNNCGLLGAPSAVTVADVAAPILVSAKTVDSDSNGFVDGIELTFSESVVDATVFAADWTVSSPAYTVASISSGTIANDNVVTLVLNEASVRDGAVTPTVTYSRAVSRLTDVAGNPLVTGSSKLSTDGVIPRLLSATSVPVSTALAITFSEPVVGSGASNVLVVADFEYHDGNMGGATSLTSISENNGNDGAVQGTVSPNFSQGDFDGIGVGDSINAKANSIFDANGNAVPATVIALVGPNAAFQVVTAIWLCVMLASLAVLAM